MCEKTHGKIQQTTATILVIICAEVTDDIP